MRTLSKTVVALGVAALMAAPVMAQQGRGRGFGFGPGGIAALLTNASVQQELKLDDGQIDKAKDLAAKIREKIESATEGLEGQERFAKIREMSKELNTLAQNEAKEFLKPEQLHRVHQIHNQVQGARAFLNEYVQDKLKLTDAQKSDVSSIVEESNSEMRELFQGFQSDREGTMKKIAEHRKATVDKIVAKLTPEQQTTWKDYFMGAPFEVKWERPAGGGR